MADEVIRGAIKTKLLEILKTPECGGSITLACRKAGCSRQAVSEWRRSDPAFDDQVREAILDGKDALGGLAESALVERINSGDTTAIIFTLKSIRRGTYSTAEDTKRTSEYIETSPSLGISKVRNKREAYLLVKLLLKHIAHTLTHAEKLTSDEIAEVQNNLDQMEGLIS